MFKIGKHGKGLIRIFSFRLFIHSYRFTVQNSPIPVEDQTATLPIVYFEIPSELWPPVVGKWKDD